MTTYEVTFKDEATYTIEAETREKAIIKASDSWERRVPPSPTVKRKNKIKRTVYYTVSNHYKQDILIDEDLDEDEIKDLWYDDNIETLSEPEPAGAISEIEYDSIWVV